jgi:diguanylate cyclase (GGDEF)-like protein
MSKSKNIILASSVLVSVCMVVIALGLALYLPNGAWQKRSFIALLVALSPVPLVTAIVALRSLSACAGTADRFATRDPLTSLYNQSAFWDLLEYETERSKRQQYRFSLLAIDLDNFKAINDRYGHEAGDAFLVEFSTIFKTAVRKGDIPARYGGDNFAAILPVCDEAQAYIVAKRILDGLRGHTHALPDGASVRITASIGVAVFPDHAQNGKDLYLLADGMLYHAKTAGKDRLSVPGEDVDLDELRSAGAKSILVMEALRAKRIIPYFQPIVDVNRQTVLAYEVLTRIVTPDRIIPAAEFIEAAEGMGAIGKINHLLIENAFALAKQENYRGQLFINLSPKALVLNEFMPTVRKLLADYGLAPSQIVFEITERDTVKNLDLIRLHVHSLKQEGFRFAIDDFGSGYSSFRYITAFEVDFLKVDGEFIRNMAGTGRAERAIVSNIAALAGTLGIKTIAEYVETEAILGNVQSAGIDYAQGYYIQHPSPHLRAAGYP